MHGDEAEIGHTAGGRRKQAEDRGEANGRDHEGAELARQRRPALRRGQGEPPSGEGGEAEPEQQREAVRRKHDQHHPRKQNGERRAMLPAPAQPEQRGRGAAEEDGQQEEARERVEAEAQPDPRRPERQAHDPAHRAAEQEERGERRAEPGQDEHRQPRRLRPTERGSAAGQQRQGKRHHDQGDEGGQHICRRQGRIGRTRRA